MVSRASGGGRATPQRDNDSTPVDSNAIVDYLSGGLNTITASINTPRGDSPYMRNVDIDARGNISSRSGTRLQSRADSSVSTRGEVMIPFTAKNGKSYILYKTKTDFGIDENRVAVISPYADDDVNLFVTTRLTFTGVAAANSSDIAPDYVVINEEDIRILMTFGISAPVQFRVVEYQNIKTEGSNYTTTTFSGEDLEFAATTNVLLYINGTFFAVSGVSYFSGDLTVTHPLIAAGTYTHDLMFVTWNWICEGMLLEGSDVFGDSTRFVATLADLNIPVPVSLLKDLEPLADNRALWPFLFYSSTTRGTYYTYKVDLIPTTSVQFVWSSGQRYDAAFATQVVPGFTHATIGALAASISPLYFAKAVRLRFQGDKAAGYLVTGEAPYVYANGQVVNTYVGTSSTDTIGKAAMLRKVPFTPTDFYSNTSLASSSEDRYKFISFDAAPFMGIDPGSVIEIIYSVTSATFRGSGSTQAFSIKPRSGYAFPLYGIQEHADYNAGSFPRTCTLYQGRLVLGGFPADPNKVVFSEVAGTAINGGKYANVGVAYSELLPTDPLSVTITTSEDGGRITALSQAVGSLVVFTLGNTYRIVGSGGALTPTNFVLSGIAAVGCVNYRSFVQVANSITFLSLSGVYRLSPALQIGDFDINLISIKINNLLNQRNNVSVAWMFYDDIENRMYIGFTDSASSRIANRMLVYYVQWEAWSEYTFFTGLWTASSGCSIRLNKSYQVFRVQFDAEVSTGQNTHTISLSGENQLHDFYFDTNNWPAVVDTDFDELPYVRDTITATTTHPFLMKLRNFRMLEYPEVRDAFVTIDGTPTTNWRKLSSDTIEINDAIEVGDVIVARPQNDLSNSNFVLYKDNVLVPSTATISGNSLVVSPDTSIPQGPVARFGTSIPYAYSTSVFHRNTLLSDKSNIELFVLLSNEDYSTQFLETEVNTAVPQPFSEIKGKFKYPVRVGLGRHVEPNVYDLGLTEDENLENVSIYDLSVPDLDLVTRQYYRYARVGVGLKGSGDIVQAFCYDNSYGVFTISAYQMISYPLGMSRI